MRTCRPSYEEFLVETGSQCSNCKLASCKGRAFNFAVPQGSEQAEIIFVGDLPTKLEVDQREVLKGLPGQLFGALLDDAKIPHDKIWATTSVPCAVPAGAKIDKPWMDVLSACRTKLQNELALLKNKKVIVAMGNWALTALGYADRKVGNSVGWIDWNETYQCFVLATYATSSLMRNNELYLDMQWTFHKAEELRKRKPGVFLNRPNMVCNVAENVVQAIEYLDQIEKAALSPQGIGIVASDIETSGLEWYDEELSILALGFHAGTRDILNQPISWIIPEEILYAESFKKAYGRFVKRKSLKWVWHNGKFDVKWIRNHLGVLVDINFDTLNHHYVLDERQGTHSLDTVAQVLCEAPDWESEIKKFLPNKKTSYAVIPKPKLYTYLAMDCYYTLEIFKVLQSQIEAQVPSPLGYPLFQDLLDTLLTPSLNTWVEIEMEGMEIDEDLLDKFDVDVGQQLEDLEKNCQHIASEFSGGKSYQNLNLNSPTQLKVILYDILKLKPDKKLGRTTAKKFLEQNGKHPFCAALLKHRALAKLYSTYIKGFKKRLYNGKIYADFLFHGTVTGRLSSRNPNMQNIPRSSFFKAVFIAPAGFVLCQADYSNLEVRTAAWYSEDPELLKALEGDIHWNVALGVFGDEIAYAQKAVTVDALASLLAKTTVLAEMRLKHELTPFRDVDKMRKAIMKQLRHMTKYITFGILYGRGAKSLAENELNCPQRDAQKYVDNFFRKFHVLRRWMLDTHNTVITRGVVEIPTGRQRRFPCLTSPWDAQDAKNKSVNAKCQAMASDMNLLAALRIHEIFKQEGLGKLKFAVHDSLVSILDERHLLRALSVKQHEMENVVDPETTPVKFPVDMQLGPNWRDLTDVKCIDGQWVYVDEDDKGDMIVKGPVLDKAA